MNAAEYLQSHGISLESVQKFELGLSDDKITIPVKDRDGNFLFNKYRHLLEKDLEVGKKYSYDKGAKATLFNAKILEEAPIVVVCEGEFDAIRLDQEGIPAITSTSGAGSFPEEFFPDLQNRQVFLCLDNDDAGKEGTNKILEELPTAMVVELPKGIKDICDYFNEYSKADFGKLLKETRKKNQLSFGELIKVVDKWLLLPDKNVLKVVMAAMIAHQFKSDPLWLFLIAPPSGTKTEILSSLASIPKVYFLSDFTAQTLISGMNAKKDPSLLPQLTDHVLIMKDFTTILNMRQEDRAIILSQFREIYDGKYNKTFGTGKRIEWEGKIGLIAGVTSVIDKHQAVFQAMGERFVQYRVPQPNDKEVARRAIRNAGQEKEMRQELRSAFLKFWNTIEIPSSTDVEIPDDIIDALASLASFIVKARSATMRDYKHELELIPAAEAPARFTKQLVLVIKALSILEGRNKVTWMDYYLTLRLALDAMPRNKAVHLMALARSETPLTTTQVAAATNYSRNGSEIILEDLVAFGIVKVHRKGQGSPNEWELDPFAVKEYLDFIVPEKDDTIFQIFPAGDFYSDFIQRLVKVTNLEELSPEQQSFVEMAESQFEEEVETGNED